MGKIWELLAIAESAERISKSTRELASTFNSTGPNWQRTVDISLSAAECALRCAKSAEAMAASINISKGE